MTSNRSKLTLEGLQHILGEWCRQLDSDHLHQLIDGPVDRALLNYMPPADPVSDCHVLLDWIAGFVEYLHREAFPRGPQYPGLRARDQAIALLARSFSRPEGKGYERGLILAMEYGPDGWLTILQTVAETTKAILREQYVRWVRLSLIDPHDEELCCGLCALILDRLSPYIPDLVKNANAEEWVDCLDELVSLYCSVYGSTA